jgi:hypothetical protein
MMLGDFEGGPSNAGPSALLSRNAAATMITERNRANPDYIHDHESSAALGGPAIAAPVRADHSRAGARRSLAGQRYASSAPG